MSIFGIALTIAIAGQIYWLWQGYRFSARFFRTRAPRIAVAFAGLLLYFFLWQYNVGVFRNGDSPVRLTPAAAILEAPFLVFLAASLVSFILVLALAPIRGAAWLVRRRSQKSAGAGGRADDPDSPARRDFLGATANVITAAPFVAGAYGALYGRLNLEVTERPVTLARLPKAFGGFRIAQLSDLHIGPFMPQEQIRHYAEMTNALKPDLIALTGDFVTFDGSTQFAVVEALSVLRAPFGVWGCLGNHDAWAGVLDSITGLFQQRGFRILRGESAAITIGPASHGDSFNLIGVDFQSARRFGPSPAVRNVLGNITGLIDPNRANILLSHNPDTFDRAADIGVSLSLAGHTHGGQAALEFISPEIAPSRLVTPYVAGWFQKPGSRLYVNRGIGTIGIPLRIGAPPEITIYKLVAG
jgi:hypothetical protein